MQCGTDMQAFALTAQSIIQGLLSQPCVRSYATERFAHAYNEGVPKHIVWFYSCCPYLLAGHMPIGFPIVLPIVLPTNVGQDIPDPICECDLVRTSLTQFTCQLVRTCLNGLFNCQSNRPFITDQTKFIDKSQNCKCIDELLEIKICKTSPVVPKPIFLGLKSEKSENSE